MLFRSYVCVSVSLDLGNMYNLLYPLKDALEVLLEYTEEYFLQTSLYAIKHMKGEDVSLIVFKLM